LAIEVGTSDHQRVTASDRASQLSKKSGAGASHNAAAVIFSDPLQEREKERGSERIREQKKFDRWEKKRLKIQENKRTLNALQD
jgi:hypothetical protein